MPIIEIRMPDEEREGTQAAVGAWLKQPGDAVEEHEPLVEISTDKVTLEIAAPFAGVLVAVSKGAGDVVEPGELLGTLDTTAAQAAAEPPAAQAAHASSGTAAHASTGTREQAPDATLSPVTRRLLEELGLEAAAVPKVSAGARLTPADIAAYLRGGDRGENGTHAQAGKTSAQATALVTGRLVPHTPMRKAIASHMARSVQSAPHVTAVFEADMSNVFADREAHKAAAREVPSVTAYLIQAAVRCMQLVPEVNSRWHERHLEYFDHVHFGVGTALESGGLVVPVLRHAEKKSLGELNRELRAMTAKARDGKLTQAELEGGTFTLSNHGVGGSLMASPIILPHGQAAVLGTGKIQKRVIVCETGGRELFRVRPMMYVTLTVDHRVLDGQHADRFMSAFVQAIESPDRA